MPFYNSLTGHVAHSQIAFYISPVGEYKQESTIPRGWCLRWCSIAERLCTLHFAGKMRVVQTCQAGNLIDELSTPGEFAEEMVFAIWLMLRIVKMVYDIAKSARGNVNLAKVKGEQCAAHKQVDPVSCRLFLVPLAIRLTRFKSLYHILLVAFLRPIWIIFTPEPIVHLMTTGFGFSVRLLPSHLAFLPSVKAM